MKISVVVPIFCEEKNIQSLYERLQKVTSGLSQYAWEFFLVNDGSSDNSLSELKAVAAKDKRVKIIDLSRNFGKEIALTAGVHATSSDAVICMDADLQHPPELIPRFISEWTAGAEVVTGVRTSTEKKPILKRIGSSIFYWLMSKMSDIDMVSQATDFRLLDRKVVDAFRTITERQRMFRGIIDWMGFKRTYIEFQAGSREHDAPSYSYKKLWKLAVDSITAFSLWPLRLAGYLGVFITCFSSLLVVFMLLNYLWLHQVVFTSLAIVVVSNTILIGIVLMAIGLVALYIGTIHTEVVNRPLYIVRERLNLD